MRLTAKKLDSCISVSVFSCYVCNNSCYHFLASLIHAYVYADFDCCEEFCVRNDDFIFVLNPSEIFSMVISGTHL